MGTEPSFDWITSTAIVVAKTTDFYDSLSCNFEITNAHSIALLFDHDTTKKATFVKIANFRPEDSIKEISKSSYSFQNHLKCSIIEN